MFVQSIRSKVNNNTLVRLNDINLNNTNNYFEVVYGNKPMHPYIDIDGELDNISSEEFNIVDNNILDKLKTLDVSIMSSSKYGAFDSKKNLVNKLSYRLTYFNEICKNRDECKSLIQNEKYPIIKDLLKNIINVNDSKTPDSIYIDYSVYRSYGKMRAVNAYKYPFEKDRINRLIKGSIEQTIISNYNNMDMNQSQNFDLESKLEPINIKNNFENIIITPNEVTNHKIKKYEDMIQMEKLKLEKKQEEKIKKDKENLEKKQKEKIQKNKQKDKNNDINKDNTMSKLNEILNDYFLNEYLNSIDINKLQHSDWVKLVLSFKSCDGEFDDLLNWNKKYKKFDYDGLNKLWNKYSEDENEMSIGTLKYYSKLTNPKKYNSIVETINYTSMIIFKCTEKNIAKLYINLNHDNLYVYNDTFYIFRSNRWSECNNTKFEILRHDVSENLGRFLNDIIIIIKNILLDMDDSENIIEEDYENFRKMFNKLSEVELITGKTQWINNIVREVRTLLLNNQSNYDIFDKQHHLFAFNNVIFNLNTNEQVKFDKKLYITTNSGKNYNEPTDEQLQTIHNLFVSIFPDPEQLKCYLSILRTGLSGKRLEKIIVANGNGRNGKGFINELMGFICGNYYYKLPVDVLTKDINMMGANPQLANLNNKRFVVCCEPEDGRCIKMHTAKELTGCDTINARGLYESKTETNLLLTLVIEANNKPELAGRMDNAILNRLIDVNFVNTFSDNPDLVNNIDCFAEIKEYKHYNFKLAHYCAMFKYILLNAPKELYIPSSVRQRSKEYVVENEDFYGWFEEKYTITNNDDDILKMKDLFNNYKNSEYYTHLTKRQKRKNNYKNFCSTIRQHLILKNMYRDKKIKKEGKVIDCIRLHGIIEKNEYDSDIDSD